MKSARMKDAAKIFTLQFPCRNTFILFNIDFGMVDFMSKWEMEIVTENFYSRTF